MSVVVCPRCKLKVSDYDGRCFACGAVLPRVSPEEAEIANPVVEGEVSPVVGGIVEEPAATSDVCPDVLGNGHQPMDTVTKVAIAVILVAVIALMGYLAIASHERSERTEQFNREMVNEIMDKRNNATGLTNQQALIVVEALGMVDKGMSGQDISDALREKYDGADVRAALQYIVDNYSEGE